MNSSVLPYCVFLSSSLVVPNFGVQGREVHRLDAEDLSLIYSELDSKELIGDHLQAAALEFHQTLQSIFAHAAIIPFRFPTFLTESELQQHLSSRAADYRRFLKDYADHAQMEIRVLPAQMSSVQNVSGTDYMKQKAAERRHLVSAADKLEQIRHAVSRWTRREVRDSIHLFALVERQQVSAFRIAVSNLSLEEVKLRVTGPWPATEFFAPSEQPSANNVVSIARGERS